ncbi:hypothetical protein HMI01_17610 [Halolactibacillus miurensis]|uniref:Uncharacterized protein n=1 Tax=Halolactibacillus miurensis TaxID=306541 RepID=A0A1I6NY22_9BACI|nr:MULTISPECIES: hypothetical protein [Halolactibacillus]GEM04773.1 hypothetical protein HMI01_17610 [Halolactibacillus miurensis]SFS32882.1 hypothetical protein SAMN05421668_10167 [Halolactibacillus miurensis]
MLIADLLKVYNENYGLVRRFIYSFKKNKFIIIPYIVIIALPGVFYLSLTVDDRIISTLMMVLTVSFYFSSIVYASYIHQKIIVSDYKSINEYEEHKIEKIDLCIKENVKINSEEDYQLIDTLLVKEIKLLEDSKKIPLSIIIRQLIVSVLITGLLTYSLRELMNGNNEVGMPLFKLYMLILGTMIMISSFLYMLKEFSKINKLKQISKIITELQLRKYQNK